MRYPVFAILSSLSLSLLFGCADVASISLAPSDVRAFAELSREQLFMGECDKLRLGSRFATTEDLEAVAYICRNLGRIEKGDPRIAGFTRNYESDYYQFVYKFDVHFKDSDDVFYLAISVRKESDLPTVHSIYLYAEEDRAKGNL